MSNRAQAIHKLLVENKLDSLQSAFSVRHEMNQWVNLPRCKMKPTIIVLSLVLLLNGCVTYPYTGNHVPVEGAESLEEKTALASKVLAALPIDQVREQIRQRYPQLSAKQLKRIHLRFTRMNFVDKDKPPHQEVHLVLTIYQDKKLYPIAREIAEFVASLLREELNRQRSASRQDQ